MCEVTLIASGKGGVGKSTFSAATAALLADRGIKTLLIDGDVGLRCLDILLGLSESVVYDWLDVLCERASPADALIAVPEHPNLFLAPAPLETSLPKGSIFKQLVEWYSESFDYIIIDAPAGVCGIFPELAAAANHAVIVATSDAASVRSAYRAGDILRNLGITDIRLAINKVRPERIRAGLSPDLDSLIDKTEIRLIGVIPFEKEIAQSALDGRFRVPEKSTARKALCNISLRLTGKNIPLAKL